MKDPYATLGVSRTASDKEIRAAYRKLAKDLHPDLHPDQPGIEERFKDVSAAYDLLSDPEKRRRFDAGEIDADGVERPQYQYYRDFAGAGPGGAAAHDGFENAADFEEFLSGIFGGGAGARRRGGEFRARGGDVSYALEIGFLEAAKGGKRRITLPDGRSLDLTIPEGAKDGQTLRLKGQGHPGFGGGPNGDAFIELKVAPHSYFTAKDNNIHVDLPVTIKEAVLGGQIEVPTIDGPVKLTVPKGSNSGTTLRLKERGLKDAKSGVRGHQFVRLQVVLPDKPDPKLEEFLERWEPPAGYRPRAKMG